MGQIYKIFINKVPVYLKEGRARDFKPSADKRHPAIWYARKKDILRAIELIENDEEYQSLTIYGRNISRVRNNFFKNFTLIEAAGGLVTNPDNDILMIYRKGHWDLPKGKIDPGESRKKAALREIEEETNAKDLKIKKKLIKTYHIYTEKRNEILKITHWYLITSSGKGRLIPEKKENIQQALWVNPKELPEKLENTYLNILDVLSKAKYIKKRKGVNR